jgi:hypothetical protein
MGCLKGWTLYLIPPTGGLDPGREGGMLEVRVVKMILVTKYYIKTITERMFLNRRL